jgi:hypothetical protein
VPPDTSPSLGDFPKINYMRVMTIPPGHQTFEPVTVAYLHPDAKEAILSYPGFPAPIVKTPFPFKFSINSIPGKGFGAVATTNIEPGELIIAERPLIAMPAGLYTSKDNPMGHRNQQFEAVVNCLGPDSKKMFFDMHNCKSPGTGSNAEKVGGIIDTNAIRIGALPGYNGAYAAVCGLVSRLNHRFGSIHIHHISLTCHIVVPQTHIFIGTFCLSLGKLLPSAGSVQGKR